MKTTEEVLDTINEVLEKPVIGCPTIHDPNQKPRKDYYDYNYENQLQTIVTVHIDELIRVFDTSAVTFLYNNNTQA